MGFFSNLDVEKYDREYSDRQLIGRINDYFLPHKVRVIWIIVILLLIAVASSFVPIWVSRVIDKLDQEIDVFEIAKLASVVFASGLFVWLTNWLRRRLTVRMIGDVVMSIRVDAFSASASHDLSFYDEISSGRIVSRITSDSREFGQMVQLITDLVSQMVQALILGVALLLIEPKLMAYVLAFLPIIFLVAVGFRRLARTVTRRGMRAMGNVNAAIKETVSGISVAKNFRQENAIFDEFDEANQASFKVNLQRGVVLSLLFPTLNTVLGIGTAMLLYLGGLEVAGKVVTFGAWFLFLQSLDRFFFPILNLSSFWAQLQAGLSAAERAFALIDAEPRLNQVASDDVGELKGEIQFQKINFHYVEDEPIMENFDLHIQPGENLAFVGHTGAGKSSIAKLVARFYEFQGGEILIDGKDIRSFDLAQYRSQLGIVSQVPFLFSGTVAENIRYARPDASDTYLLSLAKQIGDGEWLETLPQGLETEVGERGGRLSMGQRQLVSLLRVLAQEPAIFILDEATASIDPFTEWQIQQALELILRNTTSILIAHRLSTVKAADRILVLDSGRITEEGDHLSLLKQDGHYANLYNTYFRHQSLEYVEQARTITEGD